MERAHVRTQQLPPLQRGFERSRLEEQLVATAYELAFPVHRQSLSLPQREPDGQDRENQSTAPTEGVSA